MDIEKLNSVLEKKPFFVGIRTIGPGSRYRPRRICRVLRPAGVLEIDICEPNGMLVRLSQVVNMDNTWYKPEAPGLGYDGISARFMVKGIYLRIHGTYIHIIG